MKKQPPAVPTMLPFGWQGMTKAQRELFKRTKAVALRCPVCDELEPKVMGSRSAEELGAIRQQNLACCKCGWRWVHVLE